MHHLISTISLPEFLLLLVHVPMAFAAYSAYINGYDHTHGSSRFHLGPGLRRPA